MILVLVGALVTLVGAVPMFSASVRERVKGPVPFLFPSSAAVKRGYWRAQQWLHLSVVCLGLTAVCAAFSSSVGRTLAAVCALLFLASSAVFIIQVAFNRPRYWIPREAAADTGALVAWIHARRGH